MFSLLRWSARNSNTCAHLWYKVGVAYLLNESKADIMKPTTEHVRVKPCQTAQEHETLNFFLPVKKKKDRIYIVTMRKAGLS